MKGHYRITGASRRGQVRSEIWIELVTIVWMTISLFALASSGKTTPFIME